MSSNQLCVNDQPKPKKCTKMKTNKTSKGKQKTKQVKHKIGWGLNKTCNKNILVKDEPKNGSETIEVTTNIVDATASTVNVVPETPTTTGSNVTADQNASPPLLNSDTDGNTLINKFVEPNNDNTGKNPGFDVQPPNVEGTHTDNNSVSSDETTLMIVPMLLQYKDNITIIEENKDKEVSTSSDDLIPNRQCCKYVNNIESSDENVNDDEPKTPINKKKCKPNSK